MAKDSGVIFQATPHNGSRFILILGCILLGMGVWLAVYLFSLPISSSVFWSGLASFFMMALGGYFIYRAITLFQLKYTLNRNGIAIHLGTYVQYIPFRNIITIIPAESVSLPARKLFGIRMPNWWIWRWDDVMFCTTADVHHSLVIQTPSGAYTISPRNKDKFMQAWQLRTSMEPTQEWSQTRHYGKLFNSSAWFDTSALQLIATAILLCIGLIGMTFTLYPTLPNVPIIEINSHGETGMTMYRYQFLWIPTIGVIILIFNLIFGIHWHKHDKLTAYMLWILAIIVQIGLSIGAWMIVF